MNKDAELLVDMFELSIEDAKRIAVAARLPKENPEEWGRVAEIIDAMGQADA